jgi:outer membrane protein
MKKSILIFLLFFSFAEISFAQKFAYVDSDYILNKIPEYKQAQDKLDKMSAEWQKEIETKKSEVEQMWKAYQQEQILLSEKMKRQREEAIIKKENDAITLQHQYFGPEGELNLKQRELIKPLQDKIYSAVQQLSKNNKYQIVFDSSSDLIMLYKNNNLDKSDRVLELMGY